MKKCCLRKIIPLVLTIALLLMPMTARAEASADASSGGTLAAWTITGLSTALSAPKCVAADKAGNIYITDSGNSRVVKVSAAGAYIKSWGGHGTAFSEPWGIAADSSGNIYVVDRQNDRIQKFDQNGNFILQWGSNGNGNGQFITPKYIAIDSADKIYISDYLNGRVQVFDKNGKYLKQFKAASAFGYAVCNGIAVDSSGNVYLADEDEGKITKYNSSGTALKTWGNLGSQADDAFFWSPQGLVLDNSGHLYVAEWQPTIQEFDLNGNFIAKWGTPGDKTLMDQPTGIAFDPTGNMYVADTQKNIILKKAVIKYTIALTLNSTKYGSVSGAGTYVSGAAATITAKPKQGYRFVNWLENDKAKTYKYQYKFTVTGNRKFKAVFAVIPKPSLTSATATSKTSIKLAWKAVIGANSYYVYRSKKSGSGYTKIATCSPSTIKYTSSGLTAGTTYYYKIQASFKAGSVVTVGGYSNVKYAKTKS